MQTNKTEEQKHSIIRKYKDFEIRFYPSATIVTINSNAKTYRDLSGIIDFWDITLPSNLLAEEMKL
jgi:hypothetical protein